MSDEDENESIKYEELADKLYSTIHGIYINIKRIDGGVFIIEVIK